MRRIFCVWVVILLLASAAPCGLAEESSAVDALLEQLSALMDAHEYIYEVRDGAYQAVAEFCAQNDYAALLNARIACDEAGRKLRQTALPEMMMPEEMLVELMQMSVETDAVEAEIQNTRISSQGEVDGMAMYEALLYTSVYQLSQLDTLQGWLGINQRQIELAVAYDCNLLNYVLLPVAEDPAVMRFWNGISARWPMIGAARPAWEDEQARLLERTSALMKEYESVVSSASRTLGQDEYAFEQFSKNLSEADMEALKADANVISGMPTMLPLPDGWLSAETATVYAAYGESGDGSMPETLMIYDADVSLEDFRGYVDTLTALGASLFRQEGDDENGWQMGIAANDQVLSLHWYPGDTVVAAYDPRQLSLETFLYILCVL